MIIWLLIVIALIVIVLLSVVGLVVWPEMQIRRAEQAQMVELERHYQAGVAFQEVNDWDAAAGEYRQVITGDANYKDTKDRLGVVKARLVEMQATATAVAIVEADKARATTVALATTQAQATVTTKSLAATATVEAIEMHYRRGMGFIGRGRWEDAKNELEIVFDVDPDYKDVQANLREVEDKMVEVSISIDTETPSPTKKHTPTPKLEKTRLENLQIPSDGTLVLSQNVLERGVIYSIIVEGVYRYDEGEAGEFADAKYLEDDNDQWILVEGKFRIGGRVREPDREDLPSHRYVYLITGDDARLSFQIKDLNDEGEPAYDDNQGHLNVQIYQESVVN